jgi:hypothetical protein
LKWVASSSCDGKEKEKDTSILIQKSSKKDAKVLVAAKIESASAKMAVPAEFGVRGGLSYNVHRD